MMNLTAERRPYAATANVMAVLARARTRNLPPSIDNDYLRIAGIPEVVLGRVTEAQQFLGLIDDDKAPTEKLRAIAAASDGEFRELLAGTIREAYAQDFAKVNPELDGQSQIIDAFRRYEPRSQTHRMVMLFLGLCREAGIPVKDAPRDRKMASPNNRHLRPRPSSPTPSVREPTRQQHPPNEVNPKRDNNTVLFGVTEEDIGNLDEDDFTEVWAALGKVARARARAKQLTTLAPSPSDGEESIQEEVVP